MEIQKKLENKKEIANEMNKQFAGTGAKLASKLESAETNFKDYLQYPNPNHERIILNRITEPEVGTLILEIDVSKSLGIDDIPPIIVKWCAPVLIPILTTLFNKCLVCGIYPDSLKVARVRPIYKGDNKDKNDASSYRPISILTQFNQIFEKLIRNRLYDFVKTNYIGNNLVFVLRTLQNILS